jgi:putative ABC transport system permease protein
MKGTDMSVQDSFRNAVRAIRAAKMRSFLTMLGIIIGIAAVVMLMGVGNGAKQSILGSMQGAGAGNLDLMAGGPQMSNDEELQMITMDDLKYLKAKLTYPVLLSPRDSNGFQLKNGSKTMSATEVFVLPAYFKINGITIAQGRGLADIDVDARTRNVVIGTKVASTLFPGGPAVGKKFRIGDVRCKVVGVTVPQGTTAGIPMDSAVALSFPIGPELFGMMDNVVQDIQIKCVDPTQTTEVKNQITRLMIQKHKKEDFTVQDMAAMTAMVTSSMSTLTTLLAAIGGLSLLVGGIGIMNIMLVSVTERTREIGIRKALGAKERDILGQFLIESSLLSVTGGLLGIIISILASKFVVARFTKTAITSSSVLLAFGFSIAVGIFFGVYPARRAARLKPVDALRYE